MNGVLPILYFLVLTAEAVGMTGLYLWLRPASASWLNLIVGSVALASMIAMLVYSLARRIKLLRDWMRLSSWLHLHIFLGLQGILLAFVHCLPLLWRGGWPMVLNPGMLNLYAVAVVFASGVFGRYLFGQVPKTLGGQHLAAKAVEEELAALDQPVPDEVRALWAQAPGARSFVGLIRARAARRRAVRALRAMRLEPKLAGLCERRVVLEHQKASLQYAQRIFRWWILLHRPVAAAMYLLSFVHVILSLAFSPLGS